MSCQLVRIITEIRHPWSLLFLDNRGKYARSFLSVFPYVSNKEHANVELALTNEANTMILRLTPNFSGIMIEEGGLETLDSYRELLSLLLDNLKSFLEVPIETVRFFLEFRQQIEAPDALVKFIPNSLVNLSNINGLNTTTLEDITLRLDALVDGTKVVLSVETEQQQDAEDEKKASATVTIDIQFPGDLASDGIADLFSKALDIGSEIMSKLEGELSR